MAEDLKPACADDVAQAPAFTLRYTRRKRVTNSAEIMAAIVAQRPVNTFPTAEGGHAEALLDDGAASAAGERQ